MDKTSIHYALVYWGGVTPGQRPRTQLFQMRRFQKDQNDMFWKGRKLTSKHFRIVEDKEIVHVWRVNYRPTADEIKEVKQSLQKTELQNG